MNIFVAKNVNDLATKAARQILALANEAIGRRGRFTIALAGGSTPKPLYAELAGSETDWKKWTFFFGDERDVSPDDEQSNLRMASESLFKAIPSEQLNVVSWNIGSTDRAEVAAEYSSRLRSFFGSDSLVVPRFDVILLGMGEDGHTASLFPSTAALQETERLATANFVPKLNAWRYTLTYPVINNARNVFFIVTGSNKASTLREVIRGEHRTVELPAQGVDPHNGTLTWYIDEPARELLAK